MNRVVLSVEPRVAGHTVAGYEDGQMPSTSSRNPHGGLAPALGAYVIWGLLPLYLILVRHVPAFEFVGWRVVFTLPFCLILVGLLKQWAELAAIVRSPRLLGTLTLSAALIGSNWLIYIAAIQAGHVYATSIGYYINPLVNVLLGTAFLGERLRPRQWLAVALATVGVGALAIEDLSHLWISLTLGISFGVYGLVRKLAPVGAITGLTAESAVLTLPALAIVGWYAAGPAGSALGKGWATDLLVAVSGVLTGVPLMLFAVATRRMSYTALGFIQFLSPTLVFLLGLFVFHEPLNPMQLGCFVAIWGACAIFTWDLLKVQRERT